MRVVGLAAWSSAAALAPFVLFACQHAMQPPPAATRASSRQTAASGSAPGSDCRELLARTDREYDAARARAQKSCSSAADCQEVWASCDRRCGGKDAIAKSDVARYREATASLEIECARFDGAACTQRLGLPAATCPVYRADCSDGTCREGPWFGDPPDAGP
jgi:hypothetical protein